MKSVLKFILFSVFLFSCRKHRLDEDYSSIEGKWRWAYSIEYSTLWPIDSTLKLYDSKNLAVEFTKNARIKYYEDGNCFRSQIIKRMKSDGLTSISSGEFIIFPNSGDSLWIHLSTVSSNPHGPQASQEDTLRIYGIFPIENAITIGEKKMYSNIFIREK